MDIIARAIIEYKNKDGILEDCTIRFKLTMKGKVSVWEEIKLADDISKDPNYSVSFRGRVRLVDTNKEWIHNGIGRIKVKFQESDLSNYIGDKR